MVLLLLLVLVALQGCHIVARPGSRGDVLLLRLRGRGPMRVPAAVAARPFALALALSFSLPFTLGLACSSRSLPLLLLLCSLVRSLTIEVSSLPIQLRLLARHLDLQRSEGRRVGGHGRRVFIVVVTSRAGVGGSGRQQRLVVHV